MSIEAPDRGELVIAYDCDDPEIVQLVDDIYSLLMSKRCSISTSWPDGKFEEHRIHFPD